MRTQTRRSFTPSGYGGYVSSTKHRYTKPATPLTPAYDAYNTGNYAQAEAEAQKVVESTASSTDPAEKRTGVEARQVLAFSAAGCKGVGEEFPVSG